jgi:DUF917 family protein
MLKDAPYHDGRVMYEGKATDVFRHTTEGFARGRTTVESAAGVRPELSFQNEHLIARAGSGASCRT